MRLYSLPLLAAVFSPTPLFATITPSLESCDDLTSCSPSACVASTDTTCSLNVPTQDIASSLSSVTCNSECTPSSDELKCTDLKSKLKGDAGIKAAYCTDEFLVVWSNGRPNYDPSDSDYLGGIPLPPGGDTSCRVRTSSELLTVYKIPIAPPADQTGTNAMGASGDAALPNVPGMPEAGCIGMAIDGVPMFPNYNNRGQPAATSCEIDRCNAHSGKGDDYHYHGDPFGSKCLYDEDDYGSSPSTTHPPLIGFAMDGYGIYGRHTDALQEGADVDLDDCGGHVHTTYGYHYHSFVTLGRTTTSLDGVGGSGPFTFDTFDVSPSTCWKGDVSQIANFWESKQAAYDRSKSQTPTSWVDYDNIRPCCGDTNWFASSGYTIPGVGACGSESGCDFGTSAPTPAGVVTTAPTAPSPTPGGDTGTDAPTGGSTACASGNDSTGKKCPPDTANGPCPPGCEPDEDEDEASVNGEVDTSPDLSDVGVVLLAGGTGSRMKASMPKQFLPLNGSPILTYSLNLFLKTLNPSTVVLVLNEEYHSDWSSWLSSYPSTLLFASPGVERQGSVLNGLKALKSHSPQCKYVAVHDSARPLVTVNEVNNVVKDAKEYGAATLGVKCKATIKESEDGRFVERTIQRSRLWEIHTPQVISIPTLLRGFDKVENEGLEVTDDASVVEHLGEKVKLTEGEYTNLKITTPEDLEVAASILRERGE
ncbi:hypothetical protein TrVE_jg9957 [Triparma verrucosa]|uniref:2-C-methyl-D-erythritol 4-phosphate cytidylyltransferase, chloroplastic n=1 Tax=Triparma verrucosa TaxID=1606542 RepID=A0A9W7EYW0_9STRA|nr:hypothetical protein TrVE_jg9957 [Triparma verrucosa]